MDSATEERHKSAWEVHLPRLLQLLNGLAQHAVDDTNRTGIAFLAQLQGLENRVNENVRNSEAALEQIQSLDVLADSHKADREQLGRSLHEAMTSGRAMQKKMSSLQATLADVTDIAAQVEAVLSAMPSNIVETQEVKQLREDLATRSAACDADIANAQWVEQHLKDQDGLLQDTDQRLAHLSESYAELLDLKRKSRVEVLKSGQELEASIREAISSAQIGDIIRQQIETIMIAMVELSEIATADHSDADIGRGLSGVLDGLAGRYVMKSQRDVHQQICQDALPLAGEEEAPRMELF